MTHPHPSAPTETIVLGFDRFACPASAAPAARAWLGACARAALAADGGPEGAARWHTRAMAAAHEAGHLVVAAPSAGRCRGARRSSGRRRRSRACRRGGTARSPPPKTIAPST